MINNFGIQERNTSELDLIFAPSVDQEVPFSSIKSNLKTGDVVLVDGRYSYSFIMDIIQGSKWGHAAMVVRAADIDPNNKLNLPDPLLWESNSYIENSTINLWGSDHAVKEGPMLISMEERLRHSKNNFEDVVMAVRTLQANRDLFDFSRLKTFFSSVIDKGFPNKNSDIVLSVLLARFNGCRRGKADVHFAIELDLSTGDFATRSPFGKKNYSVSSLTTSSFRPRDPKDMYCTELLAATYKILGLLRDCPTNYAYVPKNFSETGNMKLLRDASLGHEVYFDILS